MGNNDPKRESELDGFRQALSQGRSQMPPEPGESTLDKFKAALGDVAERSTSWVSARVTDTLQDFVGRVLYGETVSPEASDKHQEPEREGMDR